MYHKLYLIPYALFPVHCTLCPMSYALCFIPLALHPSPFTLNPILYTPYPIPYTLYPIFHTLRLTSYILKHSLRWGKYLTAGLESMTFCRTCLPVGVPPREKSFDVINSYPPLLHSSYQTSFKAAAECDVVVRGVKHGGCLVAASETM